MMLAVLLALVPAEPAPAPTAAPDGETEIVVIGNKLRDWRGTWRVRDGVVSCKTKRSTGDREIDAVGCDAMIACMTPLAPQWQEIEAADLGKTELQSRLNGLLQSAKVADCLAANREQRIAALAATRRSKRT